MGLLQNIVKNFGKDKEKLKAKLKEAQEDDRVQTLLENRKKSSNERDLETRLEKKRQEKIKMALDKLRKEDTKENWKSKNSILAGKATMLINDRPILKEKNIFKNNPNLFSKAHTIKSHADMGFFK